MTIKTKAPIGRPRTLARDQKDKMIRFPRAELEACEAQAKKAGVSSSEWLRTAARHRLARSGSLPKD